MKILKYVSLFLGITFLTFVTLFFFVPSAWFAVFGVACGLLLGLCFFLFVIFTDSSPTFWTDEEFDEQKIYNDE